MNNQSALFKHVKNISRSQFVQCGRMRRDHSSRERLPVRIVSLGFLVVLILHDNTRFRCNKRTTLVSPLS